MASTPDGRRYVAGLQDTVDPCCYKDFYEGEKQGEAIEKAQAAADKHRRKAIVYDRKGMGIIHRCTPIPIEGEQLATAAPVKPMRKRGK